MNEFYLKLDVEPLEEGGGLATGEELPGLVAQRRIVAETMEIAQDVARNLIRSYVAHGDPLPRKVAAALKRVRRKTSLHLPVGIPAEFSPA